MTSWTRRDLFRAAGAMAASTVLPADARAQPQTAGGKRIGFVDDRLDNFHANTFLGLMRGPLAARGFEVTGCFALDEGGGRAWAAKNTVPYMASPDALNAAVDAFMVLAPSTPDTHLDLASRVAPFGKPVYVDKTFAPDLATARQIFAIADKHNVPLQSTSVLRHTNVQDEAKKSGAGPVEHMIAWGGGGSFGEYAVHPLELLISVMGHEVESLMRRGAGDRSQLLLNFSGGRTGVVNVYTSSSTPYAASLTTRKGTRLIQVEQKLMFQNGLAATLDFFESGRPNIDRRETLAIMALLDAAGTPDVLQRFVPITV